MILHKKIINPSVIVIGIFIILYTLLFAHLRISKFESFSSDWSVDLAGYNQALWNTVHGKFLYQTVLYKGMPNHSSLILLFFVPFYFLFSLWLAAGAVPVYLIKAMVGIVIISLSLAGLYKATPFYRVYKLRQTDYDAWELIGMIPQEASVTAEPNLIAALSGRRLVHVFNRQEYHGPRIDYLDVDYILIDVNKYHSSHCQNWYVQYAQKLLKDSRFKIAAQKGEWTLFRNVRLDKDSADSTAGRHR